MDAYSGFVRNVKRADEAIRLETTTNIKFQGELKNIEYKNKTECVLLFTQTNKRNLVNVNNLLIKFLNSELREQQSQHLTGFYRSN